MISDFFINKKGQLNLQEIYAAENSPLSGKYNRRVMVVLAISFTFSMAGVFFPSLGLLKMVNDFAFFSGLITSFVLYTLLTMIDKNK